MTRPTPDAAAPDVWRVEFTDGIVATGTSHDYEDGTFAGHVTLPSGRKFTDEGISPEDAVRRAAAAYCRAERDALLPSLVFVAEVTHPGEPSRAELTHRAAQGAVDTARIDRALATIDALTRERDALAATLARLRAPSADVAAIGARAASLATLRTELRAYLDDHTRSVFDIPVALIQRRDEAERESAADVPALLALLAAEREGRAAEVAGARAAALREAEGAVLARIVDLDGRNESAGVLPSVYARLIVEDCARAIAALGAKGGG